jgi:hypothetical protein
VEKVIGFFLWKSSVISTNQMPSKRSLVERKASNLVEKVIGFFL